MEFTDLIRPYVEAEIRRQHDIVEAACERSLTDGRGFGVKVVRDGTRLLSAEPDESVPYGNIHEYRLDLQGY